MTATASDRNLAAELRWVEEGHHVHVDPAAGCFWTVSDTTDRRYEMQAHALLMGDGTWPIAFGCDCPAGSRRVPVGTTACKHRAGLARRLEREGLARLVPGPAASANTQGEALGGTRSSRWEATEKALGLVEAAEAPTACIVCGATGEDVGPFHIPQAKLVADLCNRCASSDLALDAVVAEAYAS